MEVDPTRMCELLVGLGEVDLVGINDSGGGAPLGVVIRSRKARPSCEACGGPGGIGDRHQTSPQPHGLGS